MKTTTATATGAMLYLGRQGERYATQIRFPAAAWREAHGDGAPLADYRAACDAVRDRRGTAEKIKSGELAGLIGEIGGAPISGACTFDADTSDADAGASEILAGQTAYVNGVKLTGAIDDVWAFAEYAKS